MILENNHKPHFVYCLILDKKPIYVGCCENTKIRENAHRKLKSFDYLFVIKKYSNKKDALIAENALIRFLSLLNDDTILNGLFKDLKIKKEFIDSRYRKEREVFHV